MDNPHSSPSAVKTAQDELGLQTLQTSSLQSGDDDSWDLDAVTPTAPSSKTFPSFQDLSHIDMGTIPEPLERRDTLDSFQSSIRRTNTGWSIALSTTTDYTEPDQADHATAYDDVDEHNASSSSRHCPSTSTPPTRAASFNVVDDDAMPSTATPSSDLRPLTHPNLLRLKEMSSPSRDSGPNRHPRGLPYPGPLPIRSKPSAPRPREGQLPSPRPILGQSNVSKDAPSAPIESEDATPMQGVATGSRPRSEAEWVPDDTEEWATDVLSASQSSEDAGDNCLQKLDGKLIEDVCDSLLKHVFGVDLQDLAVTDAAATAYSSVSYCLEELNRIVAANNGAPGFGLPVSQAALGHGDSAHTPILPAGGSDGGERGGQSGRGSGGNKGKQPSRGDENPERQGESDDGNGSGGSLKRPRDDDGDQSDQRLSCPFRKRNPVKFNVRDHQNCAVQSFPDISQLKRHVKIFHKQKTVSGFACPRCKRNMGAKEALEAHLAVDNDRICSFQVTPSSQNPEDGINAKTEDLLNERRANTKVDNWEILWLTLFPDDVLSEIPDPVFVPPIELDEVFASFHTDSCREELKKRLLEEDLGEAGLDSEDHVARLVEICEQHIDSMFETCRRQKIGNLPAHKRRKRVLKPKVPPSPADTNCLMIPNSTSSLSAFASGASNENSPAESLDTPHSAGSWSYVGQPTLTSPQVPHMVSGTAAMHPAHHSYLDMHVSDVMSGTIDAPALGIGAGDSGNVPSPDGHLTAFNSPVDIDHNRKLSGDSAVSFEPNFAGGAGGPSGGAAMYHQLHHRHQMLPQQVPAPRSYHSGVVGGFIGQGMPPANSAAGFHATSVPMHAMPAGTASPELDHPFGFPLDGAGYGAFSPQPRMDGRNRR